MNNLDFPVKLKIKRGIDGDNGATPWYTTLKIGEKKQKLNFAFDSGTNYSWITSNRCTTNACLIHQRFQINNSPSFVQISDQFNPEEISFGPWGSMKVSSGSDVLAFKNINSNQFITVHDYIFYLSHSYSGSQFKNLVWDGAIGIPSHKSKDDSSELINAN